MRFSTLVLEGDTKEEKKLGKEYLYCKYFHITRMLSELLKGIDLDGSGKLTVVAKPASNGEKYIQSKLFNASIYYLGADEIDLIANITKCTEDITVLQILINVLLDIAKKNNCDEFVKKKIKDAADFITENEYVISEKINKLSKKSKCYGVSANVYRTFSKEVGEGWSTRLVDLVGNEIYTENMVNSPSYVDRLNNYFSKAIWADKKFIVFDRFGKEVYTLDISSIQ